MTRQTNTVKRIGGLVMAAALIAMISSTARATIIGGVDFPQGALSFADAVVSYAPVVDVPDPVTLTGESPDPRWRVPADALGIPNFTPPVGATHNQGQFVSLGNGGFLTLQFVDNKLTGSGTSADDLYIFEVGPVKEKTHVWISQDNTTWLYVGFISGSTGGLDIDPVLVANSLPSTTQFGYVQLQDDAADSFGHGFYAGADIDAVGAVSSVPEPATLALLMVGGVLVLLNRRNRRIRYTR